MMMGKGYELADGSLSTDYEIGDEFVVVNSRGDEFTNDSIVAFYDDDCSTAPLFKLIKGKCMYNNADGESGAYISWKLLTPTHETKRKAQARKRKFTINKGDYIDGQQFSREERDRFCELAVECGFTRIEGVGLELRYSIARPEGMVDSVGEGWHGWSKFNLNNITPQFREFLGKEKGVSKKAFNNAEFTKADLKDGMRLTDREGDTWWVCGTSMVFLPTGAVVALKQWRDNLTFNDNESCDIMKVTDRDGTVLFEREEEPRELTIEEIAEAFNLPVERVRIKK